MPAPMVRIGRAARGVPRRSSGRLPAAVTSRGALRLARSMRATSSAGITYSSSSRQAKTTKVAKAPTKPERSTIHQMCQISAKPITVAKKAQTKPVGLLRGISIGLVVAARRAGRVCSRARCLMLQ